MAFSVIEPHPSVPKARKTTLSTGRGGAGNFSTYDSSALTPGPTAAGPASRFSISSKQSRQADKSASKHKASTTTTTTTTSPDPQPMAPLTKQKSPAPKAYSAGIGGAGNFHPASDRRMFSFDEELERAQRLEAARNGVPVYHFGRGGAGNLASSVTDRASTRGSAGGRASSTASTGTDSSTESRGARRALGSWIRGLSTSRE